MTGKTHFGVGIIATAILSEYLNYDLNAATLTVCAVASLLPDVDHPKGFLNQYLLPFKSKPVKVAFYVVLGVFLVVLDFFYFNSVWMKTAGAFLVMIGLSAHRDGVTHSIPGFLSFSGILAFLANTYGFPQVVYPFLIGYGLHLLCDMMTSKGVPLFFPFKRKKYKFPITFTVGSWWCNLFEGALISAGLLYLVFRLPVIITKFRG